MDKVIEELLCITSPSMMEICGNEDNTDEEKNIGLDVEEGEKSIDTEN